MSEPYIGEIKTFAFNYAPYGWLFCAGQELPVSEYQALYAVVGNTYGGAAGKTFKLPNLMPSSSAPGLAMVGVGTGASGTPYILGKTSGTQGVTLTTAQQPSHSHTVTAILADVPPASYAAPIANTSRLNRFTAPSTNKKEYSYIAATSTPNVSMNAATLGPSYDNGGASAHDNMQPYLPLNICIAWDGIFPTSD